MVGASNCMLVNEGVVTPDKGLGGAQEVEGGAEMEQDERGGKGMQGTREVVRSMVLENKVTLIWS